MNGDIISKGRVHYYRILVDIWTTMLPKCIVDNTTFDWKPTNEKGKLGFNWNAKINMSIRQKNANGTMLEIVKMIYLNKFSMNAQIRLADKTTIQLNIG